jgi:hypothetical protein
MEKETSFREVMLWVRLAMTFNVLYHEIKTELSKEQLTVPQLDIISCLDRSKGLPLSELAERLLVTGGNVTGIIDRRDLISISLSFPAIKRLCRELMLD